MFRNVKVMMALVCGALLTAGGVAYAAPGLTGSAARNSVRPLATGVAGITQSGFVAITPCRIVDTRKATGGILVAGHVRQFVVAGGSGFTGQGGKNGGCGIPAGATAITASLSATGITGTGIIHAWPSGSTEPQATVVNYNKAAGSVTTGQTLGVRPNVTRGLEVKAMGKATQFVIDVTGYYQEPIAGIVLDDGTLASHTSQVVSAGRHAGDAVGVYQVNFTHAISGCADAATAGSAGTVILTVTVPSASTLLIFAHNINGAPVNADVAFTVTC